MVFRRISIKGPSSEPGIPEIEVKVMELKRKLAPPYDKPQFEYFSELIDQNSYFPELRMLS